MKDGPVGYINKEFSSSFPSKIHNMYCNGVFCLDTCKIPRVSVMALTSAELICPMYLIAASRIPWNTII
jgi:hypothetical protein